MSHIGVSKHITQILLLMLPIKETSKPYLVYCNLTRTMLLKENVLITPLHTHTLPQASLCAAHKSRSRQTGCPMGIPWQTGCLLRPTWKPHPNSSRDQPATSPRLRLKHMLWEQQVPVPTASLSRPLLEWPHVPVQAPLLSLTSPHHFQTLSFGLFGGRWQWFPCSTTSV